MARSNFPNGFPQGVTIRSLPISVVSPGKVFFVHSGTGGNGNLGTLERPFATLDYAVGRCRANKQDMIFVMPGHTESIPDATTLLLDVAGITIVGLGQGASRPTFTFTTANTAKIPVSAANIEISNCVFVGNFLSIATVFLLTTAPGFRVYDCSFRDTSAILGFLSIITTTVAVNADGLEFVGNERISLATTSPGPDILIAGTIDRVTVTDNVSEHRTISNNVAALIEHGALVVTGLVCARNRVYSVNTDTATGAVLVKTTAVTGSGMIFDNYIRALDVAAAILVTATAVQYGMFNNLYTGETTLASGFVLPAIATDA